MTKHCRPGVLNNRHLFPQSSGGLKSNIKVLVVSVFAEASLLGFRMAAFSLCPQMAFSLCKGTPDVSTSVYKDASPVELRIHSGGLT